MYQSDIFCLFSNQSLIIDTEISKIISLSIVIHFFIFPQIIILRSRKRGGALIGGEGDKWKKYGCKVATVRFLTDRPTKNR